MKTVTAAFTAMIAVVSLTGIAGGTPTIKYAHSGIWAGSLVEHPSGDSDAATNADYVTATWKVPNVPCVKGENSYDGTWVGIGGEGGTGTLVQTGTQSGCNMGKENDNAWWELLPSPPSGVAKVLGYQVKPGNVITAIVTRLGGNRWRIQIADPARKWSYNQVHKFQGNDAAADIMIEVPQGQEAAKYGTQTFSKVDVNGSSLASWDNVLYEVDMEVNGKITATSHTPSGTAFKVTQP